MGPGDRPGSGKKTAQCRRQPGTGSPLPPWLPWIPGRARSEKGAAWDEAGTTWEAAAAGCAGPWCLWPWKRNCSALLRGARHSSDQHFPHSLGRGLLHSHTLLWHWGAEPLLGAGVAPQPEGVRLQERHGEREDQRHTEPNALRASSGFIARGGKVRGISPHPFLSDVNVVSLIFFIKCFKRTLPNKSENADEQEGRVKPS